MTKCKVVIACLYFGDLPDYLQLWLDSCGNNEQIDFLVVTDDRRNDFKFPANVTVKYFDDIESIFQLYDHFLGFDVARSGGYKLNDYKPLYYKIIDYFEMKYDYWGFCDLDVVFGNLDRFIGGDPIKSNVMRFGGHGHLSIFKSSDVVRQVIENRAFEKYLRKIYMNEKPLGFDEHHGINVAWMGYFDRYESRVNEIIDIDPGVRFPRLAIHGVNYKNQYFAYEDGSVFQYFKRKWHWERVEFSYIHFQKRDLDDATFKLKNRGKYLFSQNGFKEVSKMDSHDELLNLAGDSFDIKELIYLLKKKIGAYL